MGKPSTQIIASWVVQHISDNEWRPLRDVCFQSIKKFANCYDDFAYELVDENLYHVGELLRNKIAEFIEDGEFISFEIDEEIDPYVRSLKGDLQDEIHRLRSVDSGKFEIICSDILQKIGGKSSVEGSSNDGGVDFICLELSLIPSSSNLLLPLKSKCILIGQAKRYKDGHFVKEKELRDFVGGASSRIQELRVDGKLALFTPLILAFWTSSDFSSEAKSYAKKMGIWYMSGWTMINYLKEFNIVID